MSVFCFTVSTTRP